MNHQQALGQNQFNAHEQYGLGYFQQYDWATLSQIAQQNMLGQLRSAPLEPQTPDIDYLAITRDVAGR